LQLHLIALVRTALENRGMTQSELAVAVGISDKHMNMMLMGHVGGSLTVWDKMLWHLMIPVSAVGPRE
jgi:DNA-binding XRE family transcriptional regulator